MLINAASRLGVDLRIMESTSDCPAYTTAKHFTQGNIQSYEDVIRFGKNLDILSIEIEKVNIKALYDLEKMGVEVYPNPKSLEIIADKGLQKEFYSKSKLPSSPFSLHKDKKSILRYIESGDLSYPFVQKARKDGYDGKGVAIIKSPESHKLMFDVPSVVEAKINIDKEVAIIASRNKSGEIKLFDPVEMIFDSRANLVQLLFAPSNLEQSLLNQLNEMSTQLIRQFNIIGLLAIEYFVTTSGELLINEVAPRPHNSGHHSIEACVTSQFEQHIRAIANLPLGDPSLIGSAVMINLLGTKEHTGRPKIEHQNEIFKTEGAHMHWYGKNETKPFRKMGHITVTNPSLNVALEKAKFLYQKIKVVSDDRI